MDQDQWRAQVGRLSDRQLIERARHLARAEWEVQHELLFHLIEIEKRRIHLGPGYSSIFDYLVRGLGYSESSAHRRLATSRAIRGSTRAC
ncbi:MAG: hypothetical protein HY720_04470 [Planctomycetes bacterium]|nr:hypothetical protein [Planctomycetota bacterium]